MTQLSNVIEYFRNPLPCYADDEKCADAIAEGSLLDIPPAREGLHHIDVGRDANLYTIGLPLDRASGATTGHAGHDIVLFSSYSYLGLNGHPRIVDAAIEASRRWGTTAGGVRLMTGTLDIHLECERALAEYLGVGGAALFSSGYDANLAAISSLLGRHDLAVVDERVHRSILDACRLAGCKIKRFLHNDVAHLETVLRKISPESRVMVIVDGVYSMDGDVAILPEIMRVRDKYGAFLMIDESHSIGVLGRGGRGTASAYNIPPECVDLLTGSLGKAFPSNGGFVAGSRELVTYLQHGSAPYIFSSAASPANTAAIMATIEVLNDEPHHIHRMWENSGKLHDLVENLGLSHGGSVTPIVPVLLGDEARVHAWSKALLDRGIYASAVTQPAVPLGTCRLRLCAMASHTSKHFEQLRQGFEYAISEEANYLPG